MPKSIVALCIAILLGMGVMGGLKLFAADPATQPAPTTQEVDTRPINTKCLVTGDDIDPKITVVYQGITYGFCCQDCVKAFNKNPEKYISAIK